MGLVSGYLQRDSEILSDLCFILAPTRYGPRKNGRDALGDDIPPDEINIIRSGQNYGWPYCYGKNVSDPEFNDSSRCTATQESEHDLQAHSAPLGLRFVSSAQFPEEWQGDLLVAYHGSWNRRSPLGTKW